MSINSFLLRGKGLGLHFITSSDGARGCLLKQFSQYRRLSSINAAFNYKLVSVGGARRLSSLTTSKYNSSTTLSPSHSLEVSRESSFINKKGIYWIWRFDRGFATKPAPKPSTSSLGLADQVLRASAVKEEKENEQRKQEEESKKDQEKQVRAVRFTLLTLGGIFAGSALYIFFSYGAPPLDPNGRPFRDEFSSLPYFQQHWKRARAELGGMVTMVTNPSRDTLLPDPVKPPYHQPPYTLLIELTGVLVYPDWTYKTGWRFKKRPGVDYFLSKLSGYYFEVVIYTSEQGFTAFPIIDALDTQNVVHYRLFRDSTKYDNGVHVKDLDKINRDLSKVIAIDWNPKAVHEHRNNTIVLPRWKGNDDDRTLFDLAALLQTIGTSGIEDVRGVLEYYSKFEDPIAEFRKKQQELALKEKEMNADSKNIGPTFSPASGWLGSLFRKN